MSKHRRIHRRWKTSSFVVASAAAFAASCAPSPTTQTVSFVLDLDAKRINRIEFVVSYSDGRFAGTDGECVASAAAQPSGVDEPAAVSLAVATPNAGNRKASRKVEAVLPTTSTVSSTTLDVTTTLPPTTTSTIAGPTSTTIPTTTLAPTGGCGDGHIDSGEQCDDGNVVSGDGCDSNCQAEFAFVAVNNETGGALTIDITNGLGIPPGSVLARCRFQGDIQTANLSVDTNSCGLASGGTCNPTTAAGVTVSTTTTTTTTTTSTTKTTSTTAKTTTTSTLP